MPGLAFDGVQVHSAAALGESAGFQAKPFCKPGAAESAETP